MTGPPTAGANPTKTFFVRMITRDITLEDCILDLIDNSIDSAWRSEGSRPMGLTQDIDLSKYTINITATPETFVIKDNCGGMNLNDAINYAFSFGRKETAESDDYSIGVYGIGMKRAAFKLGSEMEVRSTFSEKGKRTSFAVPINVGEWLKDDTPPWEFEIVDANDLDEDGVEIEVSTLTPAAHNAFDTPAFMQNLRRIIARDYSIHLHRGINIIVNDEAIKGWDIQLLEGAGFAPLRRQYEDQSDGFTVNVEIIGGMAAPPPDSGDADVEDEGEKRFGWYVVCNGRIVLAADKTTVSGWGTDEWPQWHRQYSGFIGLILFTAAHATALPMTTTKRSVDTSSEVYRRARPKMREVTRAWINYTNERKQSLEEAKAIEAAAAPVALQSIQMRTSISVPRYVRSVPSEPVANVNYAVPLIKLKKLARALGRPSMAYKDVGLKSFDYTFDDLVDD